MLPKTHLPVFGLCLFDIDVLTGGKLSQNLHTVDANLSPVAQSGA
jgi:hypothetical protein